MIYCRDFQIVVLSGTFCGWWVGAVRFSYYTARRAIPASGSWRARAAPDIININMNMNVREKREISSNGGGIGVKIVERRLFTPVRPT